MAAVTLLATETPPIPSRLAGKNADGLDAEAGLTDSSTDPLSTIPRRMSKI